MSDDELGSASREVGMVFRVGMQLASRFAEQSARRREQQSREAEQHSNQAAREYSERLRTERIAAETQLRKPLDPQWWDRATPHDITTAYEQAKAWESESEIATQAAAAVRSEVHRRYGIDIAHDRNARAFIDDSANKQALAQTAEQTAAGDRIQAAALIADAEQHDAAARQRRAEYDRKSDDAKEVNYGFLTSQVSNVAMAKRSHLEYLDTVTATDAPLTATDEAALEQLGQEVADLEHSIEDVFGGAGLVAAARFTQLFTDTEAYDHFIKSTTSSGLVDERAAQMAKVADFYEEALAQGELGGQETPFEPTDRPEIPQARSEAGASYDSAARREQFASDMRAAGVDDEAIAARISADICQGAPAGTITVPSTKSPRARKGRPGDGKHTDRERSGR